MADRQKDMFDFIRRGGMIVCLALLLCASTHKAYAGGLVPLIQQNWVKSLMDMTDQFVTSMQNQVFMIGTYIDAKNQMEAELVLQDGMAEAQKDYHPSHTMCVFGTNVRSLAASDVKARQNARLLNISFQDRDVLAGNVSTSTGYGNDYANRLSQFRDVYCDANELGGQVSAICSRGDGVNYAALKRPSRDIDFHSLVDGRYTLNFDLTNPGITSDEKDIIALGKSLFGHQPFEVKPQSVMDELGADDAVQKMRSMTAMRGIARQSFSEIVGMRSEGAPQARQFLINVLKALGMPDVEINEFAGNNPSYYAQMEVLTRRIYQDPAFFTNLYDKPANVQRISAALTALDLMQNRDRYESALRREMIISMIAESKLRTRHNAVNEKIRGVMKPVASDPFLNPDLAP